MTNSHAQKLVVLHPDSTVYEAARAMKDNHVGAVLVAERGRLTGILTDRDVALAVVRDGFDARTMPLTSVMNDMVCACEQGASVGDVLMTMRQCACRRVPLTHAQKPVGLVTLDDLIVERAISLPQIRDVVAAQLEQPARLKPAGSVRPSSGAPSEEHLTRDAARADATYRGLAHQVERTAGVGSPERAAAALGVVLEALAHRMTPDDARRFATTPPLRVRAVLDLAPTGPDESITIATLAAALHDRLGLLPDAALDVLLAVCDAMRIHDEGEADDLGARLRGTLRAMCAGQAGVG
jgi:uncharacterized protein (DUF2267 family)